MSDPAANISINLTHELDVWHGLFDHVKADIMLHATNKIGYIKGLIISRPRIPVGSFMQVMDGHSDDLQRVGLAVYEPRLGRTKLTSLAEHDDPECDLLYISKFHIDDEYKQGGASVVGSTALRKFLHHPFIKGNRPDGLWKVSSAVYILDAIEAMNEKERKELQEKRMGEHERMMASFMGVVEASIETTESVAEKKQEEQKWERLQRIDAQQFLRNGFFQDEAVAKNGERSFLVASCGQWNRDSLLTHEEANAIQFYEPPEGHPTPTGKDSELLHLVMRYCGEALESVSQLDRRLTNEQEVIEQSKLRNLEGEIRTLVQQGASIARSNALHAAVANNAQSVVLLLLRLDRDSLDRFDVNDCTPLMTAAETAAGRCKKDGIRDTQVLDILLAAGADASIQDRDGLTAYGHWVKMRKDYSVMMRALFGSSSANRFGDQGEVTMQAVSNKLLPPGGPAEADRAGGPTRGYVQFDDD